MCTPMPIIAGTRRPYRSDSGPITNCPNAPPIRVAVIVNCTAASPALRSRPTSGSEGRYMSVVNAPRAIIRPSSKTNLTVHILLRAVGSGTGRRPGRPDDDAGPWGRAAGGVVGRVGRAGRDTGVVPVVTQFLEKKR